MTKSILIQLTGETLDLEEIKRSLRTSDWKIIKETDGYYLTSDFLTAINDHKEIESKAKQFIDILNGAINLFYGNHKRIETGSIIQIDENGKKSKFVSMTGSIKNRTRVYGNLTNKDDLIEKPTTIELWLNKAEKNESVRDVLHFFNEISWWNLYKIFEIIRDDVGEQKELYKFLEKNDLSHFTQAAQSRELLGDKARHASKKYKPPKTFLTLDKANELVKNLFNNWIISKI